MEPRAIDRSLLPREVAQGGPQERALYAAALEFEGLLVKQLAAALAPSEDDDEAGAATQTYKQMLPDSFTDGIRAAGGLGLAPALLRSLREGAR